MPNAQREDGRPLDTPVEPVEDYEVLNEVLDDVTVGQILETTPEVLRASPALDAAVGIRNALIGGGLIWAVAAGAYLLLR